MAGSRIVVWSQVYSGPVVSKTLPSSLTGAFLLSPTDIRFGGSSNSTGSRNLPLCLPVRLRLTEIQQAQQATRDPIMQITSSGTILEDTEQMDFIHATNDE